MMVHLAEDDLNLRLLKYLIKRGEGLRITDFYDGVGKKENVSMTATSKALIRLVSWHVLVRVGKQYFISQRFFKSVNSLGKDLAGKEKALVRA